MPLQQHARRRGAASLEVVLATAVMIPLAFLALLFGIRMSLYLYRTIAALVGWPFL